MTPKAPHYPNNSRRFITCILFHPLFHSATNWNEDRVLLMIILSAGSLSWWKQELCCHCHCPAWPLCKPGQGFYTVGAAEERNRAAFEASCPSINRHSAASLTCAARTRTAGQAGTQGHCRLSSEGRPSPAGAVGAVPGMYNHSNATRARGAPDEMSRGCAVKPQRNPRWSPRHRSGVTELLCSLIICSMEVSSSSRTIHSQTHPTVWAA